MSPIRRPATAHPDSFLSAREEWREAVIATLHGSDWVTRFQEAHTKTMFKLECALEKVKRLAERLDKVEDLPDFHFLMWTDEFFRHLFSAREGLIQEVNFAFEVNIDWDEQSAGFEDRIRQELGDPDWWEEIISLDEDDDEWWGKAIEMRRQFVHRGIPLYRHLVVRGDVDLPSALDPSGLSLRLDHLDLAPKPVSDQLRGLYRGLRDYLETAYGELRHELPTE